MTTTVNPTAAQAISPTALDVATVQSAYRSDGSDDRRLSQLELALEAHVSTKHLSFVETGRSHPSRQLLVHLAQELDLPIGERKRLLLAGGFAPSYQERPYEGEFMRPLRESLGRLLDAHEPNPALVVDGLWT